MFPKWHFMTRARLNFSNSAMQRMWLAGELLAEAAKNGTRMVRKNVKSQGATSKLADHGITKSRSVRLFQPHGIEVVAARELGRIVRLNFNSKTTGSRRINLRIGNGSPRRAAPEFRLYKLRCRSIRRKRGSGESRFSPYRCSP